MYNDPIFLLSIEEYEQYKHQIPECRDWWWLRSPGYDSNRAASVSSGGSVYDLGYNVYGDYGAVRPALCISALKSCPETDEFEFGGAKWRKIGDGLAIAIKPLFKSRFDATSNDYETAEVRGKLLKWWDKNAMTVYTAETAPTDVVLTAAKLRENFSMQMLFCVIVEDDDGCRKMRKVLPKTATLGKPEDPDKYLFFETDADARAYGPFMAAQKLRYAFNDAYERWGVTKEDI